MTDKPYRDGPHEEDTKSGLSKKMRMNNCACRLCYLCLNPPLTFALYQSFGLDRIGPESKPMTHKVVSMNRKLVAPQGVKQRQGIRGLLK